jgi:hypothetical protein
MTDHQAPPEGLDAAGEQLWRDVVETEDGPMELRPDERAILAQACRVADRIDELRGLLDEAESLLSIGSRGNVVMHPAVVEERQQRDLLAKLLGRLAIPEDDDEGGEWDGLSTSARGRKAARRRWDKRGAR